MLISLQKKVGCAAMLLAMLASFSPTTTAMAGTVPVTTVLTPPMYENLASPVSIAMDPRGFYYVADTRKGGVSKFNLSGKLLQLFRTASPARAVALDNSGNLLVSMGTSVALLDQQGAQKLLLGSGLGQFKYAIGVAVDARGYIWVADNEAHNVTLFTSAGTLVKTIGGLGTASGQFDFPVGVSYEKVADQVVVADAGNHRLQFFDAGSNNAFVKSIGTYGTGPLQFQYPVGAAFEYDPVGQLNRMYVTDLHMSKVQVLDPAGIGTFLKFIGFSGLVSGTFMDPMALAFDPLNKRLIVANGNGRLHLFGIDGGVNPGLPQGLVIDPVLTEVKSPSLTMTGTFPLNTTVEVQINGVAGPAVSYTSATTWSVTVPNLVLGSNILTAIARDARGYLFTKQAIGILYSP
ncbi:NHL repeat domain protein [Citrifermentans bemidjiense Bem]|uniref:NHL repeat domain protein n=1 Tax=Citrifermentans bemidjiense (strain ATCC BAA-1014 / DSM 16622 / JCM 12645 / Bem) TaxID=404380 RepID=B5E891_CITBB|nr:NHL repeat-containing protein [Citrifermentans bemidjiense]ACH40060.1 NHL repeat domain protein [Citrifermentans bemidjiense Bem]